jgi:hypothetical protein
MTLHVYNIHIIDGRDRRLGPKSDRLLPGRTRGASVIVTVTVVVPFQAQLMTNVTVRVHRQRRSK